MTQTFELREGWNAIFLEVVPDDAAMETHFEGTPVEMVAAYFPGHAAFEFIKDPDDTPWQRDRWNVWYAPDREDAFLTDLRALVTNQAYLIKASADVTVSISGRVFIANKRWQANAFNLVGFSVDDAFPPTFADFFGGSSAHRDLRVYRLVDGLWRRVTNPAVATLKSGEAYWIYADGGSRFNGPVRVDIPFGFRLDFERRITNFRIVFTNESQIPQTLTIETESGEFPLLSGAYSVEELQRTYVPFETPYDVGTLEPAEQAFLILSVDRSELPDGRSGALLQIKSDSGFIYRLPVLAGRNPAVDDAEEANRDNDDSDDEGGESGEREGGGERESAG